MSYFFLCSISIISCFSWLLCFDKFFITLNVKFNDKRDNSVRNGENKNAICSLHSIPVFVRNINVHCLKFLLKSNMQSQTGLILLSSEMCNPFKPILSFLLRQHIQFPWLLLFYIWWALKNNFQYILSEKKRMCVYVYVVCFIDLLLLPNISSTCYNQISFLEASDLYQASFSLSNNQKLWSVNVSFLFQVQG